MLLLNPGPVTLTERVRRSLLQPDLCHRESEFYDLQEEARRRLLATHDLDPHEWAPVLMTASGTAAVESMIAALGIDTVVPLGASSVVLRAYRLPPGMTYTTLHAALKAAGFVIYAGQGELSKTLFRISTMGNLSSTDMDRLIQCFANLLE